MRLFRRRRLAEPDVSAAVSAAVGQPVSYNHLQYNSGALTGTVDVADATAYGEVLRVAYSALVEILGEDADRVVFYLSGSAPDCSPVTADQLGLPVPPSGRDLARRYA